MQLQLKNLQNQFFTPGFPYYTGYPLYQYQYQNQNSFPIQNPFRI